MIEQLLLPVVLGMTTNSSADYGPIVVNSDGQIVRGINDYTDSGSVYWVNASVSAAIDTAIANEDYVAFQQAAAGTQMGNAITSRADFNQLVEAYYLVQDGDTSYASQILSHLGLSNYVYITNVGFYDLTMNE